MKTIYIGQAQQLYQALLARGQTWTRTADTLAEWASEFEELESDSGTPKRIRRLLDWYCNEGCGALFVPLIGNAESFRTKFEQLNQARLRLKGQQLRYFDDLLDYNIQERTTGSRVQKEHARCIQKVQQQIQFIDDLANKRTTLPPLKAALGNGHTTNGKASKPSKPLTKAERELLAQYVIVSRDTLWKLMMQNPANQAEFTDRLRNHSPKLNRWLTKFNEEFEASQN